MYLYGEKAILDKVVNGLAYLSYLKLTERHIKYSYLVDLPILEL